MRRKPVIPRERAVRDIDDIIDYFLAEADERAAIGFISALEKSFAHIARNPATGSGHYAQELGLPGLRCWPVRRYPFLIFYLERADRVDVWRVMHGHRDIPVWMREPD